MIYQIHNQNIPQSKREDINNKILHVIDTQSAILPNEAIFNCYTGFGGLHNLTFADYGSFHEYTEAKKEIEQGQFFTPHELCKQIVNIAQPTDKEKIIDMCCGSGNFFNYLPNLDNVHGFDIDSKAISVAKHLYTGANIRIDDMRQYRARESFDMVIGNPPFNLEFKYNNKNVLSQHYFCLKAAEILGPAGLLVLITPVSFLQSDFWNKSQVNDMNKYFSFLGQHQLPSNAFKSVGVSNFDTKVLVFYRNSDALEKIAYSAETFMTFDELKKAVSELRKLKAGAKLKIVQEIIKEKESDFEYRVNKYLYEIRAHKTISEKYKDALAYLEKFRNDAPPKNASQEQYNEWYKSRMTEKKVLAYLKRIVKSQDKKVVNKYRLKKTSYTVNNGEKAFSIGSLVTDGWNMDDVFKVYVGDNETDLQKKRKREFIKENKILLQGLKKLVERKKRDHAIISQNFSEMERIPELDKYIDTLSFLNPKLEECKFTELQRHDMGLLFQKRYGLLNWQQGSGKTAVAYHYGKYFLDAKKVKNVIVLAPPIATKMTWKPFLERNGQKYVQFTCLSDLDLIEDGDFVIIPNSLIGKHKKRLQRFVKSRSNKVCLLFDESDEITNPTSQRTRSTLDIFRRVKFKLLATGTTTRNNIGELYSQFELMYNNSINMRDLCDTTYSENKERDIESTRNQNYGEPFAPRGGHVQFRSCFCPGKATVFGIEKHNQDIYNTEELTKLIGKAMITRKFKDFAGERYSIQTHNVMPSADEQEVYKTIIEEFHEIVYLYYKSTGDSKKEAMFRMIRQIGLLIKACSVPHSMPGYGSLNLPTKTEKIMRMVEERNEKVAIGCTTIESLDMYVAEISHRFFGRPLFVINGDVSFQKRQSIIKEFEATFNGILVCTQQSLKSSVNIPTCNEVIMESLQWNIPKMEQFYFRFIRLDSLDNTNVHFINYVGTIEQNIMALVLTKERINEFIKSGEVKDQSDIFDEYDISENLLETVLSQSEDDEGRKHISWGRQMINI